MIRALLVAVLIALAAAWPACAATPDGGGRDVSVALFSTRPIRSVTLTPAGPAAWAAHCARCPHRQLITPIHFPAPDSSGDLFAGGALRITDDATGDFRAATGLWHLRSSAAQVDIALTIPSARYVAAVLNAEAAPNEPRESLRALAILARTYALNGRHYSQAPGHLGAGLCDSTQCQAMRLAPPSQAIEDAVFSTAGETLWFGDHRAEVFFSQHCGGMTEDASAAWPGHPPVPYLRSHPDPYCLKRGSAAWHTEIPLAQIEVIARNEGWNLPENLSSARVGARSQSNRALTIIFRGANGDTARVSANALRFAIGHAVGWDEARSDAFEVAVRNGALVFDGHGHGHGVGLCQAGAAEMAAEGRAARDILAFYFPGTTVRITPADNGWLDDGIDAIAIRATHTLSAQQTAAVRGAWADAQRLFPPRSPLNPKIIFAPTTEIFRQMTLQPGWALASTRDTTIVLQPESILLANRSDLHTTLVHEMLHVLVESECNARTPLWLREGLVEALAKPQPHTHARPAISAAAIDRALRGASSLDEAARAHRAAAVRVRELLARYGFSAVRGWLESGVPAGIS